MGFACRRDIQMISPTEIPSSPSRIISSPRMFRQTASFTASMGSTVVYLSPQLRSPSVTASQLSPSLEKVRMYRPSSGGRAASSGDRGRSSVEASTVSPSKI